MNLRAIGLLACSFFAGLVASSAPLGCAPGGDRPAATIGSAPDAPGVLEAPTR